MRRERDIVGGSHYGGLYYYHNTASTGISFKPRVHLVGPHGIILRHPAVWTRPVAYPNPITGLSDLIAGSESCLYYYRFTGSFSAEGKPIYDFPTPVLEQHSDLNRVFIRFKLPCFVCGEPVWGTVGEICRSHGVDPARVVAALNQALVQKGGWPQTEGD